MKLQTVDNASFFREVESILSENLKVIFHVKGGSMRPFIQEGDAVQIAPLSSGRLRCGDIVLAHTDFGVLLHRVVSIRKEKIGLMGDANRRLERTTTDRIIGILDAAWRGERDLKINFFHMRMLALFWYVLRPLRGHLLRVYERYKK